MKEILVARGLTKFFGDFKAVDNVNLTLYEGQIASLVGPNGAGKTTLVNLISGVLPPSSGRILFLGRDVTKLPSYKRVKMGITRSFQIPLVCNQLTVFDNVRLGVLSRMGRTRRMLKRVDAEKEASEKALEILRVFGLESKKDLLAQELAHGERKLLDVAMAFTLEPKLVLLDEPTSGVSTREKNQVMKVITNVIREKGITALIVEHDMDVVFSYSDRIIVMNEGRIIADGPPDEIKGNELVESVLLGVTKSAS